MHSCVSTRSFPYVLFALLMMQNAASRATAATPKPKSCRVEDFHIVYNLFVHRIVAPAARDTLQALSAAGS